MNAVRTSRTTTVAPESQLMDGAADSRASPDPPDLEGCPVPRAKPVEGHGLAGVTRVAAAAGRKVGDHPADRPMQPAELGGGQTAGSSRRVEPGAEEDLVR